LYKAIATHIKLPGMLTEFNIHACTPEQEAMGIAYITWQEEEGVVWQGHGADTDIVIAAGYAFIDMLNGRDVRQQRLKSKQQN
jgi:2-isopropylmalate synthase